MATEPTKFFERYTVLVTETDLVAAMREQARTVDRLLANLLPDRVNRVDPPYTWTIKQVMQHILDAERVFSYRALRFARGDATALPGFDENAYAAAIDVTNRPLSELSEEFRSLRIGNVLFFASLPKEAWTRKGIASGIEWSVTDLAKAVVGHARHHLLIVEKRLKG